MRNACWVQTCDLITDVGEIKMNKTRTLEGAHRRQADAAHVCSAGARVPA